MEEKTVSVRGGMFNIEVLEGGSGPTLLYLHGEQGILETGFLEELAKSYHVVAPKHPGYGDSTGDDYLADLHDMLYYYLDFMDALDIREAILAGHGLGAMFAAELAAIQPERFTWTVLIAPFGLWNAEYPVLDFFIEGPDGLRKASFHDPESEAAQSMALPTSEGDVKGLLERVKSQRVAAKYLWPIPNRGLSKRLHRVRTPALIVWGESDGIASPRYADDFAAGMPNAKVEKVPQAGHLPQLEQQQAVLDRVTGFIS
ncbi:MAG: alpha/beta hydrolase [Dehalococcoidia bacterium]|nr:alpha/beta hydrolase [Dehalococcoidia bacterium]